MKKYLIIFAAFAFSFFVSSYSIDNVFIAKSPKLNPYYLSNLKNQADNTIASLQGTVSNLAKTFKFGSNKEYDFAAMPNSLPNELFKSVSTGVAAHDRGDGSVDLRIQPGTKVTIKEITLPDGRVIKGIDLTGE